MPDFATDPRRHDRPRRGHRLRPVHRHPLPRAAPRGPHVRGGDRRSPSTPRAGPWSSPGSPSSSRCSACCSWASSCVRGLGIGAAVVVVVTMVASLTLLPALLGFAGDRVEVTRWRGLDRRRPRRRRPWSGVGLKIQPRSLVGIPLAARACWSPASPSPRCGGRCPAGRPSRCARPSPYRWSRVIQHHPWTSVLAGARRAARPGHPGARPAPRLLRRGQLPRRTPPPARPTTCSPRASARASTARSSLVAELAGRHRPADAGQPSPTPSPPTPGVAFAAPAVAERPGRPDRRAVARHPHDRPAGRGHRPSSSTASATTCSPPPTAGTGLEVHVTGQVAGQRRLLRLPRAPACRCFIGAVLGLSFLLLMVVFRSLLVPLKAVIMNLLSIGAAYGVLVAVFQWGWLGGVARRRRAGPDRAVHPDDAVRHRVRALDGLRGLPALPDPGGVRPHRRQRTPSVADGLAATARVITAAAAIMVFVFGSFVLERRPRRQAVRRRPGRRRAHRRHHRPHGARARHHGAARRPQLVAARAGSTGSCPTSTSKGPTSPTTRPSPRTSPSPSGDRCPAVVRVHSPRLPLASGAS